MKKKKRFYERTVYLIITVISELSIYIGLLFVIFPIKENRFDNFVYLAASLLFLTIGILINIIPIKITKLVYLISHNKTKYSEEYAKSKANRRLLYQISWLFVGLGFIFLLGFI